MSHRAFPVVILAGGLATRLRPMTQSIPKSLILINGEPFINHQLRLLYQRGIREVLLCVGYLGEMIQKDVGNGQQFGLNVEYSFDGPSLLGTAGALRHALPLLKEEFFVMYGDSYLPCNYLSIQESFCVSSHSALMTVFHNAGQWDASNVEYVNDEILDYSKEHLTQRMHHIDYGLGILTKKSLLELPDAQPYDLAYLYQKILNNKQLAAYEVKNRFYEIGSLEGIRALVDYLKEDQICDLINN